MFGHGYRVHDIRLPGLGRLGLRALPKWEGFRAPHTGLRVAACSLLFLGLGLRSSCVEGGDPGQPPVPPTPLSKSQEKILSVLSEMSSASRENRLLLARHVLEGGRASLEDIRSIVWNQEIGLYLRVEAARLLAHFPIDPVCEFSPLLDGNAPVLGVEGLAEAGPRAVGAVARLERISTHDPSLAAGIARAIWLINGDARSTARRLAALLLGCGDACGSVIAALRDLGAGAAPAMPEVLRLLSEGSRWTYDLVLVAEVAAQPDPGTIRVLLGVLDRTDDEDVARRLVRTVWSASPLGRVNLLDRLRSQWRAPKDAFRREVLKLELALHPVDEWRDLVAAAGRSGDLAFVVDVIETIGRCGRADRESIQLLVSALHDQRTGVALAASDALASACSADPEGMEGYAPAIAFGAVHRDAGVRMWSIMALGWLQDIKTTWPVFTRGLSDPEEYVRVQSVHGLWRLLQRDATAFREFLRAETEVGRSMLLQGLVGTRGAPDEAGVIAAACGMLVSSRAGRFGALRAMGLQSEEDGDPVTVLDAGISRMRPEVVVAAAEMRIAWTNDLPRSLHAIEGVLFGFSPESAQVMAVNVLASVAVRSTRAKEDLIRAMSDPATGSVVRERSRVLLAELGR